MNTITPASRNNINGMPLLSFFSLLILWSLIVFLIFFQSLHWPYIGAQFEAGFEQKSIIVTDVTPNTPAQKAGIKVNDQFVAIEEMDNSISRYNFSGVEAMAGRHQSNSYKMDIEAKEGRRALWSFLEDGNFVLIKKDGSRFSIQAESTRSLFSLPAKVFVALTQSFIVLCIAAGMFVFAKSSFSIKLLTFSGIGLVVNSMTNAVSGVRELIIPPDIMEIILLLNPLFSMIFIYSLLALFWYFPSRINKFPFGLVAVFTGIFIFLAQYLKFYEFPIHPYQIPNILPVPIALLLSAIQWKRTADQPIQRASVMWFMLSIYGVTMFVVMLYSIPIMIGYQPIINPHLTTFSLSFIYIGIAFGTLKYRLFDIHRIWWKAVVWIAGGFIVILLDILLISQFDLTQNQALPLALLFAGWAYFPMRQVVFQYFSGSREINVSDHIPDLIDSFSSIDETEQFEGRFIRFIRRSFDAQEVGKITSTKIKASKITNNGLSLSIPNLSGERTITIIGKFNGRQLFTRNDAVIADTFLKLVRSIREVRYEEFDKQKKERDRIVRDLHDDVGGRLLSLIYEATDKKIEETARDTLLALKESMIVVEDTESIELASAWDRMKQDAIKRLQSSGFIVSGEDQLDSERILSAREYINLKRIVQEMVSNTMKHGVKGNAQISLKVGKDQSILITCKNSVKEKKSSEMYSGRGIANIEKRISEIGGTMQTNNFNSQNIPPEFITSVLLPFSE